MPELEEKPQADELEEEIKPSSEEGDDEESNQDSESDEEEETQDDEEGKSDDEDEELLSILKLLKSKNSTTRLSAAKQIAEIYGLKIATNDSERRESERKKLPTVAEIIQEEMGDEYDQLPSSLVKALDRLLTTHSQAVEGRFVNEKNQRLADQAETVVVRFYEDYPDAKKLESEMLENMRIFPQGEGVSMAKYMRKIYRLTRSEATERKSSDANNRERIERIKQNRSERSSSTQGKPGSKTSSTVGEKINSPADAVQAAMKELSSKK